ncbi:MAG: hypothetical protein H7A40_06605 [Chlamydiales bacterium]|nr:hypothetical protein [Chlamydiales bacterium]
MRLLVLLVFGFSLCASDVQTYARVQAHLLIGDHRTAVEECRAALSLYPESKPLQRMLVQALAKQGYEKDALTAWHSVADKLKGEEKRSVLESLAWGVLSNAKESNQFAVQYSSLIGARLARDAESVSIVKDRLSSTNALMRALAIKIACEFRDTPLIEEIVRRFSIEKNFFVRLELIRAFGFLGVTEMKEQLEAIVADDKTMAEEKACAIESLVNLYESISVEELQRFITSKRSGLRAIAPQVILHLDQKEHLSLLAPLLSDSSNLVKTMALSAFAYLEPTAQAQQIVELMDDPDPMVAITACFTAMLAQNAQGSKKLETFITHESCDIRYLAAAAAAQAGSAGQKLCQKWITHQHDAFVRANAAMGLILNRERVRKACHALYALIDQYDGCLMWERTAHPFIKMIAPSKVRHIPQISNYPAYVDQMTRLEILSVLSILDYRKAKSAVHNFLEKGDWGLTQAACSLLLGDGTLDAFDAVKSLLNTSNIKVRVQAALVMAFMGREPKACDVLIAAYPEVSRELKITILEALGAIGSEQALPFLVKVLEEPFQITRVVAASAIIQTLYH